MDQARKRDFSPIAGGARRAVRSCSGLGAARRADFGPPAQSAQGRGAPVAASVGRPPPQAGPALSAASSGPAPRRPAAPPAVGGGAAPVARGSAPPRPKSPPGARPHGRAVQGPAPVAVDSVGSRCLAGPPAALSELQLASGPRSTREARAAAAAAIRRCIAGAWEPSTRTRYQNALHQGVDSVELELGISVLPADSDVKLMTVFAGLEGRPWTSITALRAAVRAWHVERGCLAVMERAWTDRAFQFWAGLKKSADHSRAHAKRPLSLEEPAVLQSTRRVRMRDKDARALGGHVDVFRRCET